MALYTRTHKLNINIPILITALVLLFVTGASARPRPAVTLTPASVNFGIQMVGANSAPVAVTLSNNGNTSITIVGVSLSTVQFAYSGPSLPYILGPGQSFSGTVTFSPNAAQAFNDTLIFTRANGTMVASRLAGTGVQQVTSLDPPTSLDFNVAPCDANFNCVPATTAAVGQFVKVQTNIVHTGTTLPTGQLCIVDNGAPVNCGLTPGIDETWFVNSLSAGTHTLKATYSGDSIYGGSTSQTATLTVGSTVTPLTTKLPAFTTQPASRTVTVGQSASFTAVASGTAPLTYQWKKNGAAISGANSSSYTTPATTIVDNGTQFTVTVSNSVGTATSSAATLTIGAAGQLTASASTLNFGNTTVGSSNSLGVTFTNSGGSSIAISNLITAGAGFTASGMPTGTILNPGQSANLNVTFAPSGTGGVSGSVTIASNAANSTSKINLSGAGVQPTVTSITVTPADQTVPTGTQLQFKAMDNMGNDVTGSVLWSSSDTSVVTITPGGLATGLANGAVMVTASK